MSISQIVEPQSFAVGNVENHLRTRLAPFRPDTPKLFRFHSKRHVAGLRRTYRESRISVSVVVNIHAQKNARRVEMKIHTGSLRVCHKQCKRPEFSKRRSDLPFAVAP